MLTDPDTLLINGHRYMLVPMSVYPDDNLNRTTAYWAYDFCHLYLLVNGVSAE